jgi:HAE1 family hydrophobic/amphiphilic exporter-1
MVKQMLAQFPGAVKVSSVFDSKAPDLAVEIDRVKAASMGLSIEAAASAVSAAVKGDVTSRFREDDEEIDIRVRLRHVDRNSIDSLKSIILKSDSGAVMPLSKIAAIREGSGSGKIVRKNQARVNIVTGEYGDTAPDKDEIAERLKNINFPHGIEVDIFYGHNSAGDVLSSMLYAMILAVVFIYMLLASQFQSLVNPLIVMLSIPVTVLGIALSLIFTGESININSGIGIIMLCGIVVNNAIVLFDYIEKGRGAGLDISAAVIQAGRERLKPILMTTLTTVCALLPIAMGLGRGTELQRPLAVTVVGGLLFSTVLTLVFIPAIYTALNRGRREV